MNLVKIAGCLTLLLAMGLWLALSPHDIARAADDPALTPAAADTQPATSPAPPNAEVPATQPATAPATTTVTPPNTSGNHTTNPASVEAPGMVDGKVVFNFQSASLDSVLSFFSQAGGWAIIKQPDDLTISGRISLSTRKPIPLIDALNLFRSILKDKGYAVVQTPTALKVVSLSNIRKDRDLPVYSDREPKDIPLNDEFIVQIISIKVADAMQLKRDLAPFVPDYGDLVANAATNTLILIATAGDAHRIVEVVRGIDGITAAQVVVKATKLQFANAANAAKLITQIFAQDQTAASGGNQRGPRGPNIQQFVNPGQAQPATSDSRTQTKVLASSDDRTNTLVVSASKELMPEIERVIAQIDQDPTITQVSFTRPLKNADAVNVQNIVNGLFGTGASGSRSTTGTNTNTGRTGATNTNTGRTGTSSGTGLNLSSIGSTSSGTTTARPGASSATSSVPSRPSGGTGSSTAGGMGGYVFVIADAATNSVIVTADKGMVDQVKKIIDDLDRAVPQVLIKVLLAEVTHSDDLDLGVEWSAINLPNSGKSTVFTDIGVAATPGGFIYKLVESNISVTVRALEKVGRLDVLSRPYILTSDNQPASIIVGQQVPIVYDSYIDTNGGTHNLTQQQDIGIILQVTPHISPDGLVTMDVAPQISSLSGDTVATGPGVAVPIINKRAASARVAIHDGQTIVIGGMMQDTKTDTISKVPLIGDIPFLGLLFTRTQTNKAKTELLMFLTPHVALQPEVLEPISQEEKNNAKIVPKAVNPGVFEDHMHGLQIGGTHYPVQTQPSPTGGPPIVVPSTQPTTQPAKDYLGP